MKEHLLERHKEEIADAEAYEKMAEEFPEWSGVFRDIAHDERTHAEMLKHIMEVHEVHESEMK